MGATTIQAYKEGKIFGGENDGNTDFFYKPRKGDIIVVGPMKSGTTWTQQILHQIRTNGDETFNDIYNVSWCIWNPNTRGLEKNLNDEQVCNPRVFKHHEAYGVVETNDEVKHVVVVRNPYDAAYSFSKFVYRWLGEDEDVPDEDLANFIQQWNDTNKVPSVKCIATWFAHKNDSNVLFLFYEDMLKDLEAVIRKISQFVGISLTKEELKRVAYLSSYDYMSKNKEKFKGESYIGMLASMANIESWRPKIGMIREGGGQAGQGTKNVGPMAKAVTDRLWKEQVEDVFGYKTYENMYNDNSIFR